MKSAKSVPVLCRIDESPGQMPRSRSMSVMDARDRMRTLALHTPFVALPGVGQSLRRFSRSVSYQSLSEQEIQMLLLQPSSLTLALTASVLCAMLAAFQYGYHTGVLNVPEATIMASLQLTQSQWACVVSVFCVGGLLGSHVGGVFSDRIGRKNFLLCNNSLFLLGSLLESLSVNFTTLFLGRLVLGLGCGGVTVVVPLYLGEIAPAHLRGSLGTMNQFSIVVGILVANLLGKPLASGLLWRILVGMSIVPCIVQLMLSPWMLESPRWLVLQEREVEASEVLAKLRGTDDVDFDIDCLVTVKTRARTDKTRRRHK